MARWPTHTPFFIHARAPSWSPSWTVFIVAALWLCCSGACSSSERRFSRMRAQAKRRSPYCAPSMSIYLSTCTCIYLPIYRLHEHSPVPVVWQSRGPTAAPPQRAQRSGAEREGGGRTAQHSRGLYKTPPGGAANTSGQVGGKHNPFTSIIIVNGLVTGQLLRAALRMSTSRSRCRCEVACSRCPNTPRA